MTRMIAWLPLALTLFYFLPSAVAVEATELCGILDQRTAIVGYTLYFSSGNYTFNDGQTWHNTSSLYALPLDKPVDVSGPIPLSLFDMSPLPSDELAGGVSPIAGGAAGTFFYDHTTLYAYGGIIGGDANGTQNGLWTYNTTNSTWGLTIVEGGSLSYGDDTEGCFANDPSQSLSYYTGGWTMAYNNTNNGIVKFDSSNAAQPQWNFLTAQAGSMQGPDILKGSIVFVRKGQAGILVAFGGYNTTHKGTEFGAGWDWNQRSLADIFVYDIFSNAWYFVKATGEIPHLRSEFCSGVSSAPDDSSFQITMHGGWDQFSGTAFDDVYVLTLPAFYWMKVNAANDPDHGSTRNRHDCNMWQETEMIVTGGGNGGPYCNKSYPPIKVLDTSTYIWQTHFEPNSKYSVPNVVADIIGGDLNGGATVTAPMGGGWKNKDLEEVFSHTVPRDTYIYPEVSKTSSSGSSDTTDKHKHSSDNAGVIAGSVIGGIVCIALIATAVWFCTRKPKSRGEKHHSGDKPELHAREIHEGHPLRPGELYSRTQVAQLSTKTDTSELDAYQYAIAMQGVSSPFELDAPGYQDEPVTDEEYHRR